MAQNTVQISAELDPKSGDKISSQLEGWIGKGVAKGFNGSGYKQAVSGMDAVTKSFGTTLDNTNKRVISFGISLGLLGGAVKTFRDLIGATRDVDAAMAKLGSVIPLTAKQSQQALTGLFDVARKTGESFDDAADSLQAFGKQGGTLEANLKKVQVALSLARIGAIDATEATKGLIVATNAYAKSGEDIVSIGNKIAAINRVSNASVKDIIDVFGKFGAQAEATGISVNKLGGYIAALANRTSGGGANIGTTLEKVFARLGNNQNINKLKGISGLDLTDDNGQLKSGIALLDTIIAKYKDLSDAQKRTVSTVIGGAFGSQANATQAILADLTSANSIANQTAKIIASARDELGDRVAKQNQNLDTSIKNLATSAKEAGAILGNLTLGPALKTLVGDGEFAANIVKGINGDGIGAEIGKGILSGIGNVLAGPGLAVLGRVIYGVVKKTIPQVGEQIGAYGGFGKGGVASNNDLAVLQGVKNVLSQATEEEQKRYRAAITVAEKEQLILELLQKQRLIYQEIAASQASLAGSLPKAARQELVGRAAGGFIGDAMGAEQAAIARGVGGAPSSARPVYLPHFAAGGGNGIVANSSEWRVGGSIYNRDMITKMGLPPGAIPVAASGYGPIRNAAIGSDGAYDYSSESTAFEIKTQQEAFAANVKAVTESLKDLQSAAKSATANAKRNAEDEMRIREIRNKAFPSNLNISDAQRLRQEDLAFAGNTLPVRPANLLKNDRLFAANERRTPVGARQFATELKEGERALNPLGSQLLGADSATASFRIQLETSLKNAQTRVNAQAVADAVTQTQTAAEAAAKNARYNATQRAAGLGINVGTPGGFAEHVAEVSAQAQQRAAAQALKDAEQERVTARQFADAGRTRFSINEGRPGGFAEHTAEQVANAQRARAQAALAANPGVAEAIRVNGPNSFPYSSAIEDHYARQRAQEDRYNAQYTAKPAVGSSAYAAYAFAPPISATEAASNGAPVYGTGGPYGSRGRKPPSEASAAAVAAAETQGAANKAAQAEREAAIAREKQANAIEAETRNRRGHINNAFLLGSIGLDVASGFIPDAPGGTSAGSKSGLFKGALSGAATGATIGSAFPGYGTVIGAGIGFAGGALIGQASKRYASIDDIQRANQERDAQSGGTFNALQQYSNSFADIQDAQTSGAPRRQVLELVRAKREAFSALSGQPELQKQVLAAKTVDDLAKIKAKFLDQTEIARTPGNALLATAAFNKSGSDNDRTVAAALIAKQFTKASGVADFASLTGLEKTIPTHNDGQYAGYGVLHGRDESDARRDALGQFRSILGSKTDLNPGQIDDQIKQLSQLDTKPLFKLLGDIGKAYGENKDGLAELNKAETNAFNAQAFSDNLKKKIEGIQDALDASAGEKQFLARSSSQRIQAATSLLGNGKVKGFGSGLDILGHYQIGVAHDEAAQGRAVAVGTAQSTFLNALAVSPPASKEDQPHAEALVKAIESATTSEQFKAIKDDFINVDDKTAALLQKVIDGIAKQEAVGQRGVVLAEQLVKIQSISSDATRGPDAFIRTTQRNLADSAGSARYVTRATGQRLASATRILGEGRLGGLDGQSIEGGFRIQQAQEEERLNNTQAFGNAQVGLLQYARQVQASNDILGGSKSADDRARFDPKESARLGHIQEQLQTATSDDQLKTLGDKLGGDAHLQLDALHGIRVEGERQTQLVKDSVTLQRLELEAQQAQLLLARGSYDVTRLNQYSFSNPRSGARGINDRLANSQTLDELGLLPTNNTSKIQTGLRTQSATEQIRALTARALGRPVNGGLNDIQSAAQHIGDRELGERLFNSAESLKTSPVDRATAIIKNPGSVGLSDLPAAVNAGQATVGDIAITKGLDVSNQILANIDKNIASKFGGAPAAVSGSVAGGTGATTGTTGTTNAGGNGKSAAAPRTYTQDTDQSNPLTGFNAGFVGGLQAVGEQARTMEQIGAATAQNLTSSFSNFFGSLATGAERGSRAFRQFASSVFADESRIFSQSAFSSLFGKLGDSLQPSGAPKASGGSIGLASGGGVPVMLTGGEYVYGPDQARAIGPRALHALNGGYAPKGFASGGGVVQGGSGITDDVPTRLPAGSFVVKKSSVSRYGAGYLGALAGGQYAKKVDGGFLSGLGGYLGFGALAGGLIGALVDKKNRAAGFAIGAGIGGLAGGLINSANGNGFFSGSPNAIQQVGPTSLDPYDLSIPGESDVATLGGASPTDGSILNNKTFQSIGEKFGSAAILGGISYAAQGTNKTLDTAGVARESVKLAQDQAGYIAQRPAGTFVNEVKGPDGKYNIIDYSGPAQEYSYSNAGGKAAGSYGFSSGGDVGASSTSPIVPVDYSPSASGGTAAPASVTHSVAPVITVNNYGNGNVSSTAQAGGGDQSDPTNIFGKQDFADKLNNYVKQAVNDQLVEAQRPAGIFQQRQRTVANPYGA